MKNIILLILLSFNLSFVNSQVTHPIKETFDQLIEPNYTNNISLDYNSPLQTWWYGWGSMLQSYLNMYKSTGDKAYLNKFIKHSFGIQMRRGSNEDWRAIMLPENLMLYTGTLIGPMAEFVYIIKSDPQLYSTYLLTGIIPPSLDSPNQVILGYGDYANWLQARITQTLDYMIENYWIDIEDVFTNTKLTEFNSTNNSFCNSGISECVNCPKWAAINFQAGYAVAMLYLGYLEPINYSNYNSKALSLVVHFKNIIQSYSNNSFIWFHNEKQFDCGTPFKEDVAHGAMDLKIAIVAHELYGNTFFSFNEMNKFSHTFTRNIWDVSNQLFHNNVFGTDYDNDPPQGYCSGQINVNGTVNFYAPGEVLAWMPLYKYDDTNIEPNDVYTVLITQTVKLLNNNVTAIVPANYCYSVTSNLSGTQAVNGLTEVVKAQWDKECVNLTLYNRDMVYNQDFIVKNKITIAPNQIDDYHQLNDNSFADPIIQSNTFDINSGVTVNIESGESIDLLVGFTAEENSTLNALINTSYCTDGMRPINTTNSQNIENNFVKSQLVDLNKINSNDFEYSDENSIIYCDVFPNPSGGTFTLVNKQNNQINKFEVYDLSGSLILQYDNINVNNFQCKDCLNKGVYIIQVYLDNTVKQLKIVVQ